jgi:hypothetical protein
MTPIVWFSVSHSLLDLEKSFQKLEHTKPNSLHSFPIYYQKVISGIPEYLVIDTVRETVASTLEKWTEEKMHYELPSDLRKRIDWHLEGVRLNFD